MFFLFFVFFILTEKDKLFSRASSQYAKLS